MIEKSGNKLKRGRGWPILKKENREKKPTVVLDTENHSFGALK